MNEQLRAELTQRGWQEMYSQHMAFTSEVNARGEVRGRSPWPDTVDDGPSFSMNVGNGLFRCFKTSRVGNYLHFLSWMNAEEEDEHGRLIPLPLAEVERHLLQELNIVNPINTDWVTECRDNLYENAEAWAWLNEQKPWNRQICHFLGVGWDDAKQRVVLPCYDRVGALINARLYRPGGKPKCFWVVDSLGGNFLWPHQGWNEPWIILCEGEGDAITLRSYGFNGVSGTMGAGQPVPEGNWFRNKQVYLCFDIDPEGRAAEATAIERMARDAHSIRIIDLPDWPDRSDKADVSEYVSYLRSGGATDDDIQSALQGLVTGAREIPRFDAQLDAEPVSVAFSESQRPDLLGQRIRFQAQILAISGSIYKLPTQFHVTCPAEGHAYCRRCPMHNDFSGNHHAENRPGAQVSLSLIDVNDREQQTTIKDILGVPINCPDFRADPEQVVNAQFVVVGSPIQDVDENDLARYEALFILPDNIAPLEASREYTLTGFCYSHPKNQKAIYIIDSYRESETSVSRFTIAEETVGLLRQFQPRTGQTVYEKLTDVAQDYIDSVTGIRGRVDLHLAYRSVWHSILRFNCGRELVDRGWMECLVLGDTSCGKSQAFKRMCDWLGFGSLVDCKNQSVAGILGAVMQMPSGEWYVMPGLYPQNDGRILGLDEFNTRLDKGSMIEHLASTRSEGIVTIAKAAAAKFRARVRSIWLANPGANRLLSEIGGTGVELIPRLIRQPEDIRRFDFALIVAQTDVASDLIQTTMGLSAPQYSQEASRALLLWTWSRREDQVVFTGEAAEGVSIVAQWMVDQYTDRIPLVERNEQRKRVAKLAVSIAAQCFSTDEVGELVIVKPEHVEAAMQLFCVWYNKPAMSYHLYSQRSAAENAIKDPEMLIRLFEDTLKPNGPFAASQLLKLREFRDRMLTSIIQVPPIYQGQLMPILISCRLIQPVDGGRRDTFEVTPAGVLWLKGYLGI